MPEAIPSGTIGRVFAVADTVNPYAKDINRLISSLIPTGKVIFQDDFESATLLWVQSTGTLARNTTQPNPLMGAACASLTTGVGVGATAEMLKRFAWLRNMVIGLEVWFMLPDVSDAKYVNFALEGYNGSQAIENSIRYDIAGEHLEYRTGAVWADVPSGAVNLWRDGSYVHVKLVVNFTTQRYLYVKFADTLVDMSTLIPRLTGSGIDRQWWPEIGIETSDGAAVMYVDDVIVTNEEVMAT